MRAPLVISMVLCGTALGARSAHAVAPGIPAGATDFPATGALIVYDGKGPRLSCTATLIAPDVVLTAAHCLFYLGRRLPAFVLAPRIDAAKPTTTRPTSRAVMHPQFVVRAEDQTPLHDLALVRLARPIRGVAPETLLSKVEADRIAAGDPVDLVGYGRTSYAAPVDGAKNHGRSKVAETRPSEWVIGAPSVAQNCDGDSGGPAFVTLGGKRRLLGIASRALDEKAPCAGGTIHARPDADLDWIAATLRALRE